MDVESFEPMKERMRPLEGIARGEMAVAEGRTATHADPLEASPESRSGPCELRGSRYRSHVIQSESKGLPRR